MDDADSWRTVSEARGFAELGLFQEAWDRIEALPPGDRSNTAAVAVRLTVCTGLRLWDIGNEIVRLIDFRKPLSQREAAGRYRLAYAEYLFGIGDIDGAKKALRSLAIVWPEGREMALHSEVLGSIMR